MKSPNLVRALGLGDATMLVVGCIVGVGIFRTASSIATHLQSPALILGLWVVGGLVSLCGALCYAELATMFPHTGGDYVYIRETYGRFWAFLFGWTKLFIERTGTIAILGFVFAEYGSRVLPYHAEQLRWVAAGAIVLLTLVNIVGIRWGTLVQNVFTALKIIALAALICAGIGALATLDTVVPDWSFPPLTVSLLPSMGAAFVFVLWTFGGWTEAAYVAEEMKDPIRNVPKAILRGLALTTALYLLVNASYLLFVPVERLAHTPLVASTVMYDAFGKGGATFITWMVACSAFGALNGYILTGARILYAIGKDHAIFARLGSVHPTFHTPARALWANAFIAVVLVFTKTFDQIMTYSTIVISLFFTMAVFGLIILRIKRPRHPRPYRAWGFPFTPLIFCLTMLGFICAVCIKEPAQSVFGLVFLLAGLPLYWWSERSKD